uniref:Thioredoxin domain-containing protein n=1 Tax=Angiostrongylus cantonensis TaxID=6313 RepID=A0A0K0DFV0_ANGCA
MWNTVVFVLLPCLYACVTTKVTDLTAENIDSTLSEHQLVFAVFGADWCPYSRNLQPIFSEASEVFKQDRPSSDVVWANIDCVTQQTVCDRYFVRKFPTLKMFIHGDVMTNEYRAHRAVPDLVAFVAEQYAGSLREFKDDRDLEGKLSTSPRNVVAYIQRGGQLYKNLFNIAQLFRDYCNVWVPEEKFAEGLTKFHLYYKTKEENNRSNVVRELYEQRMSVNPLLADGFKFTHPLHHLGKTVNDLPVLAIDSFKHMYLFPNISQLSEPGVLKQFVNDLHSGDLHRRFHQTSEQTREELEQVKKELNSQPDLIDRQEKPEHIEKMNFHGNAMDTPSGRQFIFSYWFFFHFELFLALTLLTLRWYSKELRNVMALEPTDNSAPESVFKQLKPSEKRYSLLHKTEL